MNSAIFKFIKKDLSKNNKTAIYIAAAGIILFILLSSTVNFKDKLFSLLFPKNYSLAAGPNDWAQVQKDPARSGFSAETLGTDFQVKWTYAFQPERVHSQVQAIIYSNSAYVGTETGNMYAIDTTTGAKRWTFTAGGPILHSAAADSGKVYFGAMDGAIYAVDTTSGQQVWKTQVSQKGISTAPVLAEGKIMLGGRDGNFFGLDSASGALLWKYNAGAPILMTAAYDSGKAFFGSMDMYLHAVNTSDGSGAWKSTKLVGMSMDRYWPVIYQGKVIVNTMAAIPVTNVTFVGIAPKFPINPDAAWISANGPAIAAGNLTTVTSMMAVQDTVMADYNANPSKYHKITYILDAGSGAESMVVPHAGFQVHNGAVNPPCIDRDGKLVVPVPFITSGWGRLDLNTQRIVDILYDGFDMFGNAFVPIAYANPYAAGFGNPDEPYGLSCSQNLILAMHMNGNVSGAGFTGAFDLNNRKWTIISAEATSKQMAANTSSGGASSASISNGVIYRMLWHELVALDTGSSTPSPTATPTPTPPGSTATPTPGGSSPTPTPSLLGCANTSVGLTPVNDLGTGTYQSYQGGLYPGGTNTRPAAHDSAGLLLADNIVPLNKDTGLPDPVNGKYVLLSIGMSNTSQEFIAFKNLANADSAKDPNLVIVDGAQSGQGADFFADPNNPVWTVVNDQLTAAGVTPNQVAVAWVKQTKIGPTPRDTQEGLRDQLSAIARNLRTKFPNIKIAYYSSRIYGGYTTVSLSPEPYAYGNAFAVKGLIENQINGDTTLSYPNTAPWLAWGPYMWADGLTPRSDGLIWECSDFEDDGTHPSTQGEIKVANMLLNFFKTDTTTKGWFLK